MLSKRWEPSRIPTPRFMGAWTCTENMGTHDMIIVLLGKDCENVVVWKPGNLNEQERREMYVDPGEVRFNKVFAMSGNGREASTSPSD